MKKQGDWPATEFEMLMQRVTALEKALDDAGTARPPTRAALAALGEAQAHQMSEAAKRNG